MPAQQIFSYRWGDAWDKYPKRDGKLEEKEKVSEKYDKNKHTHIYMYVWVDTVL